MNSAVHQYLCLFWDSLLKMVEYSTHEIEFKSDESTLELSAKRESLL